MDNLTEYKFDKPYYRQSEFIQMMSISLSTLKRYMEDWVKKGHSTAEMGYLDIEGFKENCWEPRTFMTWLIKHKINVQVKYDYEVKEQKQLQNSIINLNKPQLKQGEKNVANY
jgi:hypothetical protein